MKNIVYLFLLLFVTGCFIEDLQNAADSLAEAERTIDEIDISYCMDVCGDNAQVCLTKANDECLKSCDDSTLNCNNEENKCLEEKSCNDIQCMNECDINCELIASFCIGDCSEQSQDCLVGEPADGSLSYSDCISLCAKDMENSLKNIDF